MFHNLHPKCANPACTTTFEWLKGGKFFRFQRVGDMPRTEGSRQNQAATLRRVQHFWLCEPCSLIYSLDYEPGRGVLIRPLWLEFPAAENRMPLPAS